jgi:hypothetical protein
MMFRATSACLRYRAEATWRRGLYSRTTRTGFRGQNQRRPDGPRRTTREPAKGVELADPDKAVEAL